MKINPFERFNSDWALVTAGDLESFNSMTISWGSMGTIWGRKVITVYVRPERYTFEFLKKNDHFTVSFYPAEYKDALSIMGTKSGRDTDKVKESSLTPVAFEDSVSYAQAEQTFLCRKIYMKQIGLDDLPEDVAKFYDGGKQTHYIIMGEVINAS